MKDHGRDYLHVEHQYVRRFGRFRPDEVESHFRVMPRNLRRRLARKFGLVRVPIVVSVMWIQEHIACIQNELARRKSLS